MWQDRKKVKHTRSLNGRDIMPGLRPPEITGPFPAHGKMSWRMIPSPVFRGDTDPIDAVDVGSEPCPLGLVYQVKVIGALGMIDGTDLETDWKIYVINIQDPMAQKIDDIGDVPREIRDQWGIFWRFYKTAKGLTENFFYDPKSKKKISADPVWLGAKEARKIVLTSAAAYQKLVGDCLNRKVGKPYWIPGCPP